MQDAYSVEIDAIASRFALPPEARAALSSLLDDLLLQSQNSRSPSTFGPWATALGEPDRAASRPAPTRATEEGGPERLGRYEVLGRLGEGGMGIVYQVRDPALQRTMALKVLRPEVLGRPTAVARFVEEAQITAQLQHPGIVPVHEIGHLPTDAYTSR